MRSTDLEQRLWDAFEKYQAQPSDKYAQRFYKLFSIYSEKIPLLHHESANYKILEKYNKLIQSHNKYRSDGI